MRGVLPLGIVVALAACSSDPKSNDAGDTSTATSASGGSTSDSAGSTTATSTGDPTSTSDSGGTGGTGMTDTTVPADDSQQSITAFIESKGFEQEGWVSVHDVPREPDAGSTSPHGMVRVYLSPQVVAFKEQEPDAGVSPAVPGAMAVKEFYEDAEGTPVGYAAMFYAQDKWTYFCYGPSGRCAGGTAMSTIDQALYGDVSDCRFCHGGNVYSSLPQ